MIVHLALALRQAASAPGTIAVTHVTVIDGTDSVGRRDQTVIIRGNRISVVGPASSTPVPSGARVLRGVGKYLIPGLWEMHVHTDVPGGGEVLRLYVANGVLSVRDLAGGWDRLAEWRREIARGGLVGPRLMLSGPYLEGGDSPVAHLLVRTPEVSAVSSICFRFPCSALPPNRWRWRRGIRCRRWWAAAAARINPRSTRNSSGMKPGSFRR